MNAAAAKTAIAAAQAKIDEARSALEVALVDLFKAATIEIAAKYPSHAVSAVSAMGSWTITVYGVEVEDGDGEAVTKDIVYGTRDWCDEEHEVIEAFNHAWDEYQTYPTIRFDVDEAGKLTSETEW